MDRDLLVLTLAEYLGVIAVILIAGISQRFSQRRPLIFKYPQREGLVSITLYVLILVAAILLGPLRLITATTAPGDPLEGLWQRSILALFIIAAAGSALALRKQPLLSVGWSRALLGASFRLAITLVFLTIFLRGKIFAILNGVSPDQGMALVLLVVIALAEETVFRGYIQLRLSSWLGEMAGWLTTALLYTIWQIPLLMLIDSTLPLPQRLALVAAQAVVLGWLMRRTGHVLAPAMYRAVSGWISLL